MLLAEYLAAERVGFPLVSPSEIVFSPHRGVQPDVFVVPLADGRRPESFREVTRLLLGAEVLSPSRARADRVAKRTLYREVGVEVYWIVDLDSRTIARSTPGDSRPESLSDRLEWHPDGATQPMVVDLEANFADVLDR